MDKDTCLDFLFNPESIALIGASHSQEKLGGVLLANLTKFRGRIFPVNPNYPELMGLKTFASAKDIPAVDLSIIMRPSSEVCGILKELKGKTKIAIIASSGFSEIGETGLQEEVKETGKETGIRILGPNCMGIYNPYKRLDTFFLPYERLKRPKKGNVSIVSQSGAILSCVLGAAKNANMGISKAVGYGNAVDIDESDLFDYLLSDDSTDVVISYIESIGDGRKFIKRAGELSKKKSLIILKAGKGAAGQAAAVSHTGRLAGSYEVFHSILRQFGLNEAMNFDDLIDASKSLSYYPPSLSNFSSGNKVCIITNGGGSGVLAADECMRQGLDVAHLSPNNSQNLRKVLPHFYGINNPVDLTAQVKDADYITVLNELKHAYDAFLIIVLPNVYGITDGLAEMIRSSQKYINKPVVVHIPMNGAAKKLMRLFEKMKIPVYSSPERAVRALKVLCSYCQAG